jgi:hypothetical protein
MLLLELVNATFESFDYRYIYFANRWLYNNTYIEPKEYMIFKKTCIS